ncbi:MAG: tetratricopeptide repeat protein, partial [Bacteroidia bacterium]
KGEADALSNIGDCYNAKGEFQSSLENYLASYSIFEKLDAKRSMSNLMNSIGNTYIGIHNDKKALDAYTKSYEIAEKDSNKYMMGISSVGLGNIYLNKKEPEKSLDYFMRAKKVFQEKNATYPLSISYTLIGNALVEMNKYDEAFDNFMNAIEQLKLLNNTYGIAATYQMIGSAYHKTGNPGLALDYYNKALVLFKERKAYADLKDVCLNIATVYQEQKDFENALDFYIQYNGYKDSVFNSDSNKQLLEVEAKYETEKQHEKIELQNAKLRENKFESTVLLISVLVTIALLLLLYNRYSIKQKVNKELFASNSSLESKNKIIERKNKEITDSINYAKRIQFALLKEEEHVTAHLPEHFVFFQPKDIVSGDFYWSLEKENSLHEKYWYLTVADCTGHGVPGAFLTMLGTSFLNEINAVPDLLNPAEILEHLRARIIKDLGQTGKIEDGVDGMDMSIIRLNLSTLELQWAGANNPLWIIKKSQEGNPYMEEIKADKQPIGYVDDKEPFTNHTIQLKKGDQFILCTDGYADQFGGDKQKKFKNKTLQELHVSISNEPMEKQKQILQKTFDNWKGTLEQIDDVCIIGVRL